MPEKNASKFGYFSVGSYFVDVGDNRVFHQGQGKHIEPKAMQVLYHLALNAGETVSRQELMDSVWQGRVVLEDALTRTISQLRATFDDSKTRSLFLTVPKKGYRLTSDVVWLSRTEFIANIEFQTQPKTLPDQKLSKATKKPKQTHISLVKIILTLFAFFALFWLVYSQISEPSNDSTDVQDDVILPSNVSVAFLPWRNLSGDESNDYLAEMLPEELSIKLTKIDRIDVLAHYSSVVLAREPIRLDKSYIDNLEVKYLVEGSITEVSDNLRVLVRLVDKANKSTVWSEAYEDDMTRLIQLQNSIVNDLQHQIKPLANQTNPPEDTVVVDIQAYQAYLQGNYWLMNGKTSEWYTQALGLFSSATELDPNFSAAFGSLAFMYARYDYHDVYMPDAQAKALSQKAIDRALSLNPMEQNALIAEALLAIKDMRFSNAKTSLQKVLDIDPKNTRALYVYSELKLAENKFDDAIKYAQEALKWDPLSPWINVNKAIVHFWRNELSEAISALDHAIAIDPNYTWAYVWKAKILEKTGDIELALEALQMCLQIDDGSPVNSIYYAKLLAFADQNTQAQKWFSHTASLYGDSADARFWQNYPAIVDGEFSEDISLDLIRAIRAKHTRFFNLYPLEYQLYLNSDRPLNALLDSLLQDLTIANTKQIWVNHRNYQSAQVAIDVFKELKRPDKRQLLEQIQLSLADFNDRLML